jgi:glycosyltransferase involved in cell wall biosynthesis
VHPSNRHAVSVVVPTRDRRWLLEESLCTALGQRDVDLEVIVVNDGSSDDTGPFLRSLDGRVTTIQHDVARGVSAARNAGLEAATHRWVAFLDDDDLWAPEKLVAQVEAMEHVDALWSCAGALLVNERLRVIGYQHPPVQRELGDVLLARNVVPGGGSGVVVATNLARAVGGFDTGFSVFADWDFWIRLGLESPIAVVPRPLHAYRLHPAAMSMHVDVGPELRLIHEKFRSERAARGVVFDRAAMNVWVGDRHQRAGRRLPAAHSYLGTVPGLSQPKAAIKTTEALVWPKLYRVRDRLNGRRARRSVDVEVGSWLDGSVAAGTAAPERGDAVEAGATERPTLAHPPTA